MREDGAEPDERISRDTTRTGFMSYDMMRQMRPLSLLFGGFNEGSSVGPTVNTIRDELVSDSWSSLRSGKKKSPKQGERGEQNMYLILVKKEQDEDKELWNVADRYNKVSEMTWEELEDELEIDSQWRDEESATRQVKALILAGIDAFVRVRAEGR